jgi:hypothetical protein
MHLNLVPFAALWVVLAATVLVLFVRRRMVASHEDDQIHVLNAAPIAQQVAVANKLDHIDKWGKTLTVIAVAYGLLVAAAFLYQFWVSSTEIPTGL